MICSVVQDLEKMLFCGFIKVTGDSEPDREIIVWAGESVGEGPRETVSFALRI